MGSGVNIIYQNNQTALAANNTVTNSPYIQFMGSGSAIPLTGRQPGGPNYHGNSASNGTLYVGTTTINGNILLMDAVETNCASMGYAKNVAWLGTFNSTVNGTLNLSTLSTNATTVGVNTLSLITDSTGNAYTAMNNANMIIIRNLDTANTMTVTPVTNGVLMFTVANNGIKIPPSSAFVSEQTGNGYVLAAASANLTLAANNGNFVVMLFGS